jgi:tetratricopeptide (TPR) repeat protein
MTISLCMIVKDEAATLARCLESVADVADECIVVDTGSMDTTREIARAHQAQVMDLDWPNDFSAARNAALSQATGDWILVLDADEILIPEVGTLLKHLDQGKNWQGLAASDVIAVNLLRQELGACQSPYTLITRFFRRLPGIKFARPYHETVDDSIAQLQQQAPHWQVVTLDRVAIYHTGYAPEVVAQRNKFNRARALMEQHLERQPADSYILNKLAALYLEQDDPKTALLLLDRALSQSDSLDDLTRYELYYHRAWGYRQAQPEQAAEDYHQALQQDVPPKLKLGALINFGNLKKAQGDLEGAIALFQQAVDIDPSLAMAHYNLGVTQRLRGYLEEAIAAYRQAIALQPNYAEAHQNLGVALFKIGKIPEAVQSFGQAVNIYQRFDPPQAKRLKEQVKGLGIPPQLLAASYLA